MASGWVARGGTEGNEDQEDGGLDVHFGYWVSPVGMMGLERISLERMSLERMSGNG